MRRLSSASKFLEFFTITEKTYQVAISGISEKMASETEVTDSGIVGLDAAKEFFGQFKTLSEADAEWK